MKKMAICASASFDKEIIKYKEKFEKLGYEVVKYPTKIKGDFVSGYKEEFSDHYKKIPEADAIIALNLEKKGIKGYIGAGVFAEIAFTVGLNRVFNKNIEVYYLNDLPDALPYSDELGLWSKLGWIRKFIDKVEGD